MFLGSNFNQLQARFVSFAGSQAFVAFSSGEHSNGTSKIRVRWITRSVEMEAGDAADVVLGLLCWATIIFVASRQPRRARRTASARHHASRARPTHEIIKIIN
jgi:hypothetical protein